MFIHRPSPSIFCFFGIASSSIAPKQISQRIFSEEIICIKFVSAFSMDPTSPSIGEVKMDGEEKSGPSRPSSRAASPSGTPQLRKERSFSKSQTHLHSPKEESQNNLKLTSESKLSFPRYTNNWMHASHASHSTDAGVKDVVERREKIREIFGSCGNELT